MAEHAKAIAKSAGPTRAEPDSAAPAGAARHDLLDERPEAQAIAAAGRMLNGRPALAAQGAAVAALGRGREAGPRPIQRAKAGAPNGTGLPDGPKADVEAYSGLSIDAVKVHRDSARGDGIVQRKLSKKGADIVLPKTPSAVVKEYAASSDGFVLRDDCTATDQTIHVLNAKAKYLLGERHDGDVQWKSRTGEWTKDPSVNTMREEGKAIAEMNPQVPTPAWKLWSFSQDKPKRGPDQPLESAHAYALVAALRVQTCLNTVAEISASLKRDEDAQKLKPTEDEYPDADKTIELLKQQLGELVLMAKRYEAFSVDYPKFHGQPKKGTREADIMLFAKNYKTTYHKTILILIDTAKMLGAKGKASIFGKDSDKLYSSMAMDATFIEQFVKDLVGIMDAPPTANKGRIAELSKPSKEKDEMEAVHAANPYREAAMISNIKATEAPLLVQMGDAHVDRVGGGVAGSIKVRRADDFETFTKAVSKTPAPKPTIVPSVQPLSQPSKVTKDAPKVSTTVPISTDTKKEEPDK
jgi:hypothetical protein